MTQEDKQLLLKDLCARLPYGVDVEIKGRYDDGERYIRISTLDITMLGYIYDDEASIIPYLRPLSSMTEEEKEELSKEIHKDFLLAKEAAIENNVTKSRDGFNKQDWLNAHHFDYRGLIPMGLALEAPEGMYKTK